jgi:nucleobase:cation symporter-1, NCS1 family
LVSLHRAIVALGFGAIGFFLAWGGLSNAGTKYEAGFVITAVVYLAWHLLARTGRETHLAA